MKFSGKGQKRLRDSFSLTGCFVKIGKHTICKSVDCETGNVVTDIDEELVPALGFVALDDCQHVFLSM